MNFKINENTTISISLPMLLSAIGFIIVSSWAVYAANDRIVEVEKEVVVISNSTSNTQKIIESQQASISSLREQAHGLEKQNQLILQMIDD